jgi:alkylation response protein AidB-like acyl-CoA dehydrogenase
MDGDRSDDVTSFSLACKCFAPDTAVQVITDAVQLLGGYGYGHGRSQRRARYLTGHRTSPLAAAGACPARMPGNSVRPRGRFMGD